MTDACQEWIGYCSKKCPCEGRVLEVGSFDVNGNPRHHFPVGEKFPEYVGIDMREGPKVDRVMNVQKMEFPDDHFGVIIDAERLEHDNRFWVSIKEEFRVLKPGGYIIITTRSWGGMPPHDYPSDYWRFMDNGLRDLLEYAGFQCISTAYGERWAGGDRAVFAVGRKPLPADKETSPEFSIVIPSKNADNLFACVKAILRNEPDLDPSKIIVVDDGDLRKKGVLHPLSLTWIEGVKPFIFARNVNLGIKAANSDVIVLNDDAQLVTKYGFTNLAKQRKGIVSAAIDGVVGNQNQIAQGKGLRPEPGVLCFVAAFIPKAVQDKLGPLDERFTGYGFEDNDYCRRAHDAGIPRFIFDGCVVEHKSLKPTFRSNNNWVAQMNKAQEIFREKYAQ